MGPSRLANAAQRPAGPTPTSRMTGRQSDVREREADRLAEDVVAGRGHEPTAPIAPPLPPPAVLSPIAARFGPGQSLDAATRAYFEPRFGRDFSQVRVHDGPAATRDADARGAEAYTDGHHLVFGAGMFAPGRQSGRLLLAHELAHVVQQGRGLLEPGGIYLKAKAVRFQDEPTLDEVSDGKKVLKLGDKGEAVIRVAQALSELGHYTPAMIDHNYDNWLVSAVDKFQTVKGLAGKVNAGEVEKLTFDQLDTAFSNNYQVERDLISKQKAADLTAGTDTLNAEERKAAERAISTEVKSANGAPPPKFVPEIKGKGTYEDRLTDTVEKVIKSQYDKYGKGKAADHADAAKLYDWKQIAVIAKEAQKAVDAVFSKYYQGVTHAELKQGVNLFDGWDDKESTLKAGKKPKEDERANWRVQKIIEGQEVVPLDREHNAVQTRADEAAIIKRVQAKLVGKFRTELIETDKGWPGFADPVTGKIFIQRFKGATDDIRRYDMWKYFYTLIHEYIHTLEHKDHDSYRSPKSEKKGGKVLREGSTEYLSHIVWSGITFDAPLRKTIEGPFHDAKNSFKVPNFVGYAEFANAERLAGIVGIRNFLAAFLMGKAELIGKP
jgi:peptidoglycan hydrolase-like protein with peptidoglycan-binding domain